MADSEHFRLDMTIAEAMAVHPDVAEAFAKFHIGGCAHCYLSRVETLDQLCVSYGLEPDVLLEALESVVAEPTEA